MKSLNQSEETQEDDLFSSHAFEDSLDLEFENDLDQLPL